MLHRFQPSTTVYVTSFRFYAHLVHCMYLLEKSFRVGGALTLTTIINTQHHLAHESNYYSVNHADPLACCIVAVHCLKKRCYLNTLRGVRMHVLK